MKQRVHISKPRGVNRRLSGDTVSRTPVPIQQRLRSSCFVRGISKTRSRRSQHEGPGATGPSLFCLSSARPPPSTTVCRR